MNMTVTDAIRSCKLFSDLQDDEIRQALVYFSATAQSYEKGETVKQTEEMLPRFGLVLSGSITVYMDDFDGNCLVMTTALPSDTFGESLCFLQKASPVYIVATQTSEILWLSCENIVGECADPSPCKLRNRFISLLALRALEMNDRIQILSKFTIRDKLITYFSQCMTRAKSDTFTIPLDRASLAAYIGTERSALSRELSRMQKENIILINKNTVRLCPKNN